MLLAIDIGNTNITLGFFSENNLIEMKYLKTDVHLFADEYIEQFKNVLGDYNIKHCIISSVVPEINATIKEVINKLLEIEPIFINSNLNIGLKIKSEKPETAGADRIANAFYASKKCPKPAIVVDIGSAVTFDVIDNNGEFIGGLIMPGLTLQLKALNDYTSKLPLADIKPIDKIINNDTENSLLSGVIRGTACAIDGLILKCEEELKEKPYIILTGGNADIISKYLTKYDSINKELTLQGINLIYNTISQK